MRSICTIFGEVLLESRVREIRLHGSTRGFELIINLEIYYEHKQKKSLVLHKKHHGKLEVKSKIKLTNKLDLSLAYTPGVAEVCRVIAQDKKKVFDYTIKKNTVAVVTDGSAVLGLGNIGLFLVE